MIVTDVTASQFQKRILPMKYKNTRGIQNHFQSDEFVGVTPVTLGTLPENKSA